MFPLIKHIQRICKLTLMRKRSSNQRIFHLYRWYRRVFDKRRHQYTALANLLVKENMYLPCYIHNSSNFNTHLQVYLICSYHYNHFYMDDEKDYQSYSIPFLYNIRSYPDSHDLYLHALVRITSIGRISNP